MGAIASQITSLTIVYSTVYTDADQRKHQSSASLAFMWGLHRGPVNSPYKWPVTRKCFHLMTSSRPSEIMVEHNMIGLCYKIRAPFSVNIPVSVTDLGNPIVEIKRLWNISPFSVISNRTGKTPEDFRIIGKLYTQVSCLSWLRHQMEIFSTLLALCAANSPVSGEFLAQGPVTRIFDVFFDLRLNKQLSKQWWGSWFETPSRPLWRNHNVW